MTLIQFLWLAGGVILGILAYASPLPFFFKWPLAGIFVSLGAGTAFVPIQGRPMDKWIIAFIRSIYSPTQFTWQELKPETIVSKQPQTIKQTTTLPPTSPIRPQVQPQTTTPKVQAVPATANSSFPTPQPQITVTPTPQTPPTPPTTIAAPVKPTPPPSPTPQPIQTPTPPPQPPVETKNTQPLPQTETRLPVPFTPTTPNTLVGMTLTPEGKILDGALIEIKSAGLSVRATKSNQLGQFRFAKPLDDGIYQVSTEKPGFIFDTYSLDLKNQIVRPLKIQAKAAL